LREQCAAVMSKNNATAHRLITARWASIAGSRKERACDLVGERRSSMLSKVAAGKRRLAGDTVRAATSAEVKDLRRETAALKEVVAELTLGNRLLLHLILDE
jgi:hypothetical protein